MTKGKKIFIGCLLSPFIIVGGIFGYIFLAHSVDICPFTLEYVSEKEAINKAISKVIKSKNIKVDGKVYKQIHYKAVGEFKANNPDCCSFTKERPFNEPPMFVGHKGYVEVFYKARYLDENEKQKYQNKKVYIIIQDCGAVGWD